jgi:hypothetical protein
MQRCSWRQNVDMRTSQKLYEWAWNWKDGNRMEQRHIHYKVKLDYTDRWTLVLVQCWTFRFCYQRVTQLHVQKKNKNKKNSVALSPQVNYTDWATATCRRTITCTLKNIMCAHLNAVFCLSVWLWVFPSADVKVNLWMLWSWHIVLLTVRFLDVAIFTILNPL